MKAFSEKKRFEQWVIWIQEGILLLSCFLYLLYVIHPLLMIEVQSPAFLDTADFLKDFLVIPGGLTDWMSALIMQSWFSDLIISLVLTAGFWLVMVLTKLWMSTLFKRRPIHTFHLIPMGLFLVYYTQFDTRLSVMIALMINLLALNIVLRWKSQNRILRTVLCLGISLMLFWMTGGAFFIFAALLGVDELSQKRFVSSASVLMVSGILPYLAAHSVVLVPLKQAYVHNLPFEMPTELWYTGYLIPAFYLLTFIFVSLAGLVKIPKLIKKNENLAPLLKMAAGTILIAGCTYGLSRESLNEIKRHVQMVNRAVTEERWSDVLAMTKYSSNESPLILCQSNLALYETGKLLDSMFAYPQSKGSQGLIMNQTWSLAWPEYASNISWRLGLVNDSQHWAHEAIEHNAAAPDLLKRLGKIYLAKGNHEAAKRYFLNLKNVPFQGPAADHYLRLIGNPSGLAADPEFRHIRSVMPAEDLISRTKSASPKLDLLVNRNSINKMAFEYMIANLLLTGNMGELLNHLEDFHSFNYNRYPRHVQEAVLFVASMDPKFNQQILQDVVEQGIFQRFMEYRRILYAFKGDRTSAMQNLRGRYDDTFWYYFMFVKPPTRTSESQNEFQ
ncbi:MAG: hypothetical protein EHM64_00850 [Ignavibacteriae bacterium]|nr:MAG: hypothetical protein EHM64_00850 [Ignavibacteriota bacterium]